MQLTSDTVRCPECGAELELVPKPDDPTKVVAYHNCNGRGARAVIEKDAQTLPQAPQPVYHEYSEEIPFKKGVRKKKE